MAENITGMESSSWGSNLQMIFPLSSFSIFSGFLPRNTFVSIGSRRGVDGRVGYLRGVDQDLIPVNRHGLWISHGGQKDASAVGLLVNFFDRVLLPVGVFPQTAIAFDNLQRSCGAQRNTALAVDTL